MTTPVDFTSATAAGKAAGSATLKKKGGTFKVYGDEGWVVGVNNGVFVLTINSGGHQVAPSGTFTRDQMRALWLMLAEAIA